MWWLSCWLYSRLSMKWMRWMCHTVSCRLTSRQGWITAPSLRQAAWNSSITPNSSMTRWDIDSSIFNLSPSAFKGGREGKERHASPRNMVCPCTFRHFFALGCIHGIVTLAFSLTLRLHLPQSRDLGKWWANRESKRGSGKVSKQRMGVFPNSRMFWALFFDRNSSPNDLCYSYVKALYLFCAVRGWRIVLFIFPQIY